MKAPCAEFTDPSWSRGLRSAHIRDLHRAKEVATFALASTLSYNSVTVEQPTVSRATSFRNAFLWIRFGWSVSLRAHQPLSC